MSQDPRDFQTNRFDPQPQSDGTPPMPPPTAIGTVMPPNPPPRSNLPMIIVIIAVLLVIAGVGGYFLLNNNGKANNTIANANPTSTPGATSVAGGNATNTSSISNPTDTAAPAVPTAPPVALGISPGPDTRNIPPRAPIAVTFNELMDHPSTEAAFKIEPAVQGSFGWLEQPTASTLVFTPSVGYRPGTTYTVSLASSAKNIGQMAISNAEKAVTNFQTVPLAEVFRAIPAPDSKDIPTDSTIAFQFTRPMIPLTTVGHEQAVSNTVGFDPPLDGRFVWLGTTELEFQPKNGLAGGTTYHVTVHKELQDQFGATLAKDYSYSFTTVAPRVAYVYPSDTRIDGNDPTFYPGDNNSNGYVAIGGPGTDYVGSVAPTSPIIVTFNQAMDHDSVQASFHVEAVGTAITGTGALLGQHLAAPLAQGGSVSGSFSWGAGVGPAEVMTFTPASALVLDTQYRATVGAAAKPKGGSIGLGKDYTWTLSTFPPLTVTDVNFGPDGVDISFSNPVKLDTLKSNWQVQPALTYSSTNASAGDSSASFSIYAHLDPSTKYTLTLNGDIVDVAGQKLATPFSQSGTTPPAVPSVNILGTNGTASFNHGQPTNIYVGSVNGTQLNYYLWKLDAPSFVSLAGRYNISLHDQKDSSGFAITNLKPTRTWKQTLNVGQDKPNVSKLSLSLDGKADRLPPGYYAFIVELDRGEYLVQSDDKTGQESSLVFVVGDSALTMKTSNREALVWAVNQNTGKPSANMLVRFASIDNGKTSFFGEGRTDQNGLYRAPLGSASPYSLYAIAEGDNSSDAAAVSAYWSDGINPGDFVLYRWSTDNSSNSYYYPTGSYNVYLYTERPIYRPGQTVYFKGIVRGDNDAQYSLPGNVQALLSINDGNNDVYSQTVQLSGNGSFDGQFSLDGHAALGSYEMTLSVTDPNQVRQELRQQNYYQNFQVQEYRKPEYQVDVKTNKDSYINGETINTTATASYYFGGAVANAAMTVRILTADYFFSWSDPKTGDAYDFYDYEALYNRSRAQVAGQKQEHKLTTDANGQANIATQADVSQQPTSQQYTIEAAVTDSSNQEVANSTTVVVHKGQFYVGLRPDVYVAETGQPFTISVVTVSPDGNIVGNQNVKLTLYSRTWQNTQDKDESGATVYVYKPVDTQVDQKNVTTAAEKVTAQFSATQGGEYVVHAEAQDGAGNTITSATTVYVAPPGSGEASWKRDNTNRVDLISDKKLYQVGDTAKILVTSPYTGATALLTTERDGVRSTQVFHMSGNTQVLNVPLDESAVPNVYASLTLVNSIADGADAPSFRLGVVELRVDTSVKQLSVTISPDKQQYQPRDSANFTVKATDSSGKPVQADLSFAVVDKAIFALASDTSGKLIDQFYGDRALGVRTASSLAILRAQNKAYDRYAAPGTGMAVGGYGAKGGGGGQQGVLAVRTNLQDTAYWKATVSTGADGTAAVSVPLPDNLTTWRVTVKGATSDTKVGEAISDVLVTKPLLIQPVLPRFLLQGDTASPGAIVHNYTQSDQQVDVSLTVTGTTFVDATGVTTSTDGTQQTATQQVTVKAGGEAKVQWNVKASTNARAGFTIAARSANNGPSDAVGIDLPINPFVTPEVTAASGQVANALSQTLLIPYGVDTNVGALNVSLNATLAGSALDGIKYNIDFLYSDTEQTVSRFLPLLYVEDTFKAAAQKSPYSDQLAGIVSSSVQRLYDLQHKNGGWGYWEEGSYSPDYPYITAYALEGLLKAKADGASVDGGVIGRGVQYLKDKLAKANDTGTGDYSEINDLNTRAYVLDVLAQAGENSAAGQLNQLAEAAQDKLTVFGRAHLVLGLVHSGQKDAASRALQPLISQAKLQGSATAHWEDDRSTPYYYINMYSDDRDTALAAQAVLAVNPNDQLATQATEWLMQHRGEDAHWASTQETSQVIIMLAQYVAAKKELLANFNYSVKFNGQSLGDGKFDQSNLTDTRKLAVQIKDMLINQTNMLEISRDSGQGPLYYNLSLRYFVPGIGIAAYNNGLGVTRAYLPPASANDATNPPSPISAVNAGDLVHVRLTVIVPQDSYYVTIEDPLPAGFEAVNPDLNTTSTAAKEAAGNSNGGTCYGPKTGSDNGGNNVGTLIPYCRPYDGVETHDDRVTYFATYLAAGVYTYDYAMRATTPGTYYALPTRAYLMYSPETWGRSDGEQFTIK